MHFHVISNLRIYINEVQNYCMEKGLQFRLTLNCCTSCCAASLSCLPTLFIRSNACNILVVAVGFLLLEILNIFEE